MLQQVPRHGNAGDAAPDDDDFCPVGKMWRRPQVGNVIGGVLPVALGWAVAWERHGDFGALIHGLVHSVLAGRGSNVVV